MTAAAAFRVGVNYWPARSAMGFWREWDEVDLKRDFAALRQGGFDSVRIFLIWEDFQPSPQSVDKGKLVLLRKTMDIAASVELSVMPTLFTGHMSGANWLPGWAVESATGGQRFRTVCRGREVSAQPLNWYEDNSVRKAQILLATECAAALQGHPALLAWDLGNENSNCVVPKDRESARSWLHWMSDAIRNVDGHAAVTIGLHMEDLGENRCLTPRDAAEACEFLTMHGYPGYASFASGPTDERLLPFLAQLTRFLGGGKDVLFSEFGVPTHRLLKGDEHSRVAQRRDGPELVSEEEAAKYIQRGLRALVETGVTGAMLWCHSDYGSALYERIPFDLAPHELSFGMFRADGTQKPAVEAVQTFARQGQRVLAQPRLSDESFMDLTHDDFYDDPERHLGRLYGRYCAMLGEAHPFSE